MKFFPIAAACVAFLVSACAEQKSSDAAAEPRLSDAVNEIVKQRDFNGAVLIADRNGVLLKQGYGYANIEEETPVQADTKFVLASMTKSFTALLTMQLVEQGKLSLDDTIADHLLTYDAPYAGQVTIAQLLQNRSGIPHTTDIPGWFDNDIKSAMSRQAFLEAAADLPLRFEPGVDYLYSNINYYLLGLIIDEAAGVPYEEALRNNMLSPLGMSSTGQIYEQATPGDLAQNYMREDNGLTPVSIANPILFRAAASQYSTVEDLYKWSSALHDGKLLSDAGAAVLFDPEKPMAWIVGEAPLSDGAVPSKIITYNGELSGYTSILSYFPEYDGAIIILNNDNAGYETILTMTLEIAAEAFAQEDE